ncbi:MAG: NUDIX hydrolase [Candidatus Gracilibacteria bacterium]|nr:NUDIX hydrolase [Candidatus Gracilibacteria bacterium]
MQSQFPKHPRIPNQAECVFSGVRSDVYQWNQEMYDGSYQVFEMLRFLDGSFSVAITPEGNILITDQEQPAKIAPFLGLPGGSFDVPDEDPLLCAQRELLEETGYVSDEWLPWHTFNGTGNIATYTYFYIARNVRKIQEVQPDPGEKIRVFSVTFDEFIELSSNPRFHHHWPIIPILYEARLDPTKKEELRKIFFDK